MKNLFLALVALSFTAVSCIQTPSVKKITLKNQTDSASYALGYFQALSMSQNFLGPFDSINTKAIAAAYVNANFSKQMTEGATQQFDSLDFDILKTGFINTLINPKDTTFTQQTASYYLQSIVQQVEENKNNKPGMPAFENKAAGELFLAGNAEREGVITTESGLQYEVLKEGNGAKPTANNSVNVHYHGTLLDGTVFDSSVDRGEPISFGVSQVIPGWTEALQLMSVGSKYKLYIPSDLAYGNRGAGQIGANSALIFEVELLGIE